MSRRWLETSTSDEEQQWHRSPRKTEALMAASSTSTGSSQVATAEASESLRAAVTFATTEHFTLQTARSTTVTEASSRALGFLAVLSSSLIALAFIGQMSELGSAFYVFAIVLLPTLSFIGIVTFQRLAQITSEDIAYAQRIARLREFYVDLAPQLEPYLTIVRGAAAAQHLRTARPRPSGWQLFLTIAGMVALINAVIVGATGAILIDAITDDSLGPSAMAGVPAGIVTLLFHMRYLRRSESGVDGEIHDEYAVMAAVAGPPSASSPTLS
jgi:hypothetical protein